MPLPVRKHLLIIRALLSGAALLAAEACGPSDPGERVWERKCSACHGRAGRGDTRFAKGRPFADLTDDRWRHGGDIASIRRLIADGDPASPMPAYQGRLSPEEIEAVSRHVLTLWARAHGTPVPGAN